MCAKDLKRPLLLPDLCGQSLSTCRQVVLQQCQSLSSPQTSPTGRWNPSRHCWSHSQPLVVSTSSGVRKEEGGYSSVSFALLCKQHLDRGCAGPGTQSNHVILLHHFTMLYCYTIWRKSGNLPQQIWQIITENYAKLHKSDHRELYICICFQLFYLFSSLCMATASNATNNNMFYIKAV